MAFEITDLKEHNSELLKLLTLYLPDMLWVKDINGIYLYANQSVCDGLLMAKDTQEVLGKDDIFFAKRERLANSEKPDWHTFGELCSDSDQTVIDNNKAMKFEEYGNVKGELLYLEVYKAPFYDKDRKIIGTIGAGRDISELKKVQHDLEESLKTLDLQRKQLESFNEELEKRVKEEIQKQKKQERLMIHQSRQAAMGEMLESIAHQWRQPLNIIGLATANLETEYAVGSLNKSTFNQRMDIVSLNINHMSNTIDDFRNFLSPKREMITFYAERSIKDVLTILDAQLESNEITSTVNIKCNIYFNGVENEFKQVMFILFNNAIDAIKIHKQENTLEHSHINVTLSCKNNVGILEISNNGGGINPDDINSIFEPYFTTKNTSHGVGMGLYIAKNIIETRMKGSLNVRNTDSGCCFKIELGDINT